MEEKSGLPVIAFADDAGWDAWLRQHHASARGVWVKFAKQGAGRATVSKQEAIRTALCWGWIDGQIGAWDDAWFVTRFTKRGPRSRWSKINVGHVEELTAQGRMRPSGQAQVDAARADGRWDAAYSSSASRTVPPELQAALDADPAAAEAFARLDSANRYAMCYRVENARRAETRRRHVETFVGMLRRGETIRP